MRLALLWYDSILVCAGAVAVLAEREHPLQLRHLHELLLDREPPLVTVASKAAEWA